MPARPEIAALYPPDWSEISERIRHDRADDRCECEGECGDWHAGGRCGAPNGREIRRERAHPARWKLELDVVPWHTGYREASRVVLTVAHLDGDPRNNEETNLRAMCQRCHLVLDRDQHAESRRRGERLALEAAGQLSLLDPAGDSA